MSSFEETLIEKNPTRWTFQSKNNFITRNTVYGDIEMKVSITETHAFYQDGTIRMPFDVKITYRGAYNYGRTLTILIPFTISPYTIPKGDDKSSFRFVGTSPAIYPVVPGFEIDGEYNSTLDVWTVSYTTNNPYDTGDLTPVM